MKIVFKNILNEIISKYTLTALFTSHPALVTQSETSPIGIVPPQHWKTTKDEFIFI